MTIHFYIRTSGFKETGDLKAAIQKELNFVKKKKKKFLKYFIISIHATLTGFKVMSFFSTFPLFSNACNESL